MEGMNFSFFVMRGIDLWLLVGEFQPTCSPRYDVSINHEANGNAMSKTASLNRRGIISGLPIPMPPVNGRFRRVRYMLLHDLCQNAWNEKIFVTCWFYWAFDKKIFSQKIGTKFAQAKNVELFWPKQKKRNEINTLDIRQKCPPIGKNCRMTERYS